MKVLIVLAVAVTCVLADFDGKIFASMQERQLNNNRIIQGEPAKYEQFPWQVAVQYSTSSGTYFCGGSIISEEWVLTAAHCTTGAKSFKLQFGGLTTNTATEAGRIEVTTTTFFPHPKYNDFSNNDVALIKLPNKLVFNKRIRAVKLPARGAVIDAGVTVTVSGWGKTSDTSGISPVLNFVEVTTIANYECAYVYGTLTVTSATVCTKGNPIHGTCNGDSGGPLVQIEDGVATQVGVVSFGHRSGCENSYPNGFIRTEAMLTWIKETTGLNV